MSSEEKPEVIDLHRYRKAAEAKAALAKAAQKKAPARPSTPGAEPLLGSRPRAGLLLVIVILVIAALWLLPRLI